MVIDKTTGKGCAWSIASKTITRKLLADGIKGQVIARRIYQSHYDLFRVEDLGEDICVISKRGVGELEEPIWIPSFIDTGIWQQAVSKFKAYGRLDQNVENYLLPEMGEYLQSIPNSELISMTREFLIDKGVINKPIRQTKGKTYYFDKNEVYSIDEESKIFPYDNRLKLDIFSLYRETCFNLNVWQKAVSYFAVGMTLRDCIGIFLKTELEHSAPQKQTPIDQLIQSIAPPIYERVPENRDKTTFDRIRITVGLPRYRFNSWAALQTEVKKYQREIYRRVLHKLETDRQFKSFGVPINFLKLSNIMLLRDFSMEFIFELKELHQNMEK